jgi:cbb3-type cytochrome oxidase maturation protein
MEVIFIVLPLAIGLAGVALAAFYWAVRRGQFDDLDTPACRMLFDDADAGERPVKAGVAQSSVK